MQNYSYQNTLISKKQLRQLLAWSFTNYDSMQACSLADELKYLGFKYASQAGISISIEDLKVPFIKNSMIKKANQEILNTEKIYLKGKITDIERFQKLIDTWNLTSEALKTQVIYYFKNYDPLNSVYIMAFSGARGNLSQVRQLVGMRGLMSDPSGEIMNLPIKKNFREGLTITDYLMSGYGARKGIIDTALKTANSGYLTRRLIDVAQDILIREKDCLTKHSFVFSKDQTESENKNLIYNKILGKILSKSIYNFETKKLIANINSQITPNLIQTFKQKNIKTFYIRSPLVCNLYRAICQKCYGWDLATENLIDIGEAIGILAGQSIGEPGTQLTMRTFHTGGIFTSEIQQQIISPISGIAKFSKNLKTLVMRTNRGEDVLVTKNPGSLILVSDANAKKLIKIEIARNTILFPKNNQYVKKDTVIGELINLNKQIRTEIKPIVSNISGEIFIPNLKNKKNLLNNNKLIWILSGRLYNSPLNSFINFYPHYKLNKDNYIFRTKIINHYCGYIKFIHKKKNLSQCIIKIITKKHYLANSNFQKLSHSINNNNYILNFRSFKYLLKIEKKKLKTYIRVANNKQFGKLVTNYFQTLTGGICYYDTQNSLNSTQINDAISYVWKLKGQSNQVNFHRTLVWLGEETHKFNCEKTILLVDNGDFISKNFEMIPGVFSKTSGIITLFQKNNIIQTVTVKSGFVYEGKNFKSKAKKIYYPGEIIFENIIISEPSFCEYTSGKKLDQLLIRPLQLFESPYFQSGKKIFGNNSNFLSLIRLKNKTKYSYKSNQPIKSTKNLNLIVNKFLLKNDKSILSNLSFQLLNAVTTNSIEFRITEKLCVNDFISPYLKYTNIQSCFVVQKNQFVDNYTTLGYLEAITSDSLEIVKLKIKQQETKQILLISNHDCLKIKKSKIINKTANNLILNSTNVDETGKIIIQNKHLITLQKGRPYFFPNCKAENIFSQINLQYKVISSERISITSKMERSIFLNYYDMSKFSLKNSPNVKPLFKNNIGIKLEFSKLFLKKNGKLYSCLIPRFLKKFKISDQNSSLKSNRILNLDSSTSIKSQKLDRTLLIRSSQIIKNKYKKIEKSKFQLTLLKFLEYPFKKSTKSVGIYSITEDYFEQDVNSVFCKNNEFIDDGETIGLLNFEKEITGDIVQGLPRIEEILEARKKNVMIKQIPTNKKKGLLIQQTSLDPNFEFRKLGTPIKENEKINPHNLLKTYFNYYGFMKFFVCDYSKNLKYNRLINNFEASYKSFKKVQSFILNSVQSVYQSQGVLINDKHLEVIIKQMTTKVLITYEGDTPLLRREVIDLYHIQYINQIIKKNQKELAYYVPLVLGITKASLNNPSFISAASFQETTRVLTKAAIEGRIDWLRGLKENIIIGHLIPAGTGLQNYRNSFRVNSNNKKKINKNSRNVKINN